MRTCPPLTLALLAAALLAGCDRGAAADAATAAAPGTTESAPLVRAVAIELRKVRRVIETTSYLESEHRVVVLSKVSGRIDEVLVDDGRAVRAGDVLCRLDARQAESTLRQVEVQLADRRVRHELAKLETDASKRRVSQAEIERDKARAQWERNTDIDSSLIAGKEREDSKFAFDALVEALKVAEFNSKKAELEVLAAANAIAELEARVEAEKLVLAEHTIRSPIDGVVEACRVRGGETISGATELFVVIDDDDLVCHLRRPQRELAMLQGARDVTFTTDAWPGRTFHAAIDLLSPVVDQATGAFRVRIRVARDEVGALRPGMFARATILTEEQRDALMVPKVAVVNEGDRAIVFAVRDGIAHRVVIEPGLEERDAIECTNLGDGGLAPGDLVVTSGQQDLRDNVAVELSDR